MMTIEDARGRVQDLLDRKARRSGGDFAIDESETRTEAWCWVFFYNSRAYIETRDPLEALAGNGPIVVGKENGDLHELSTAYPIDDQLDELRPTR